MRKPLEWPIIVAVSVIANGHGRPALPRRPAVWAVQQHGPTKVTPPSGGIRALNAPGFTRTLAGMGKTKILATGEGFLGEIMVHRLTRAMGLVEQVQTGQAGWPPQITLKLKDGTVKKGRLSDFRNPSATEREKFSAA